MEILKNLPKGYHYNFSLSELDQDKINAKIMVDIFKELNKRFKDNSKKCPWCNSFVNL